MVLVSRERLLSILARGWWQCEVRRTLACLPLSCAWLNVHRVSISACLASVSQPRNYHFFCLLCGYLAESLPTRAFFVSLRPSQHSTNRFWCHSSFFFLCLGKSVIILFVCTCVFRSNEIVVESPLEDGMDVARLLKARSFYELQVCDEPFTSSLYFLRVHFFRASNGSRFLTLPAPPKPKFSRQFCQNSQVLRNERLSNFL